MTRRRIGFSDTTAANGFPTSRKNRTQSKERAVEMRKRIHLLTAFYYLVFFYTGCAVIPPTNDPDSIIRPPSEIKRKKSAYNRCAGDMRLFSDFRVTCEEAIVAANREVEKTHPNIDKTSAVACGVLTVWTVVYDGEGLEVYVSKRAGEILGSQEIPNKFNRAEIESSGDNLQTVEMAQAMEIAKKQFEELRIRYGESKEEAIDGLNIYDPVACELERNWRVFFELKVSGEPDWKSLPNADPPDYLIDKKNGKVIYSSRNPDPILIKELKIQQ